MPLPVPLLAFGSRRDSAQGIEFAFTNTLAPVVLPLVVVLSVVLLPAWLQPRWAFYYAGPSVRLTRTLFGVRLWHRVYALSGFRHGVGGCD